MTVSTRRLLVFALLLATAGATLYACSSASGRLPVAARSASAPAPIKTVIPFEAYHQGHINLATGLYVRTDQDLIVQGELPIIVQRTYRTEDRVSRAFGVGASHNGEWYLRGDGERFLSTERRFDLVHRHR